MPRRFRTTRRDAEPVADDAAPIRDVGASAPPAPRPASDRDPTLAARVTEHLAQMPRFTEPVEIADMKAYQEMLRVAFPATEIEVFRNAKTGPVTVRVSFVERRVDVV